MEPDSNAIIAFLESVKATHWGLLGIGLVGLELATGTTYILWPAIAALVTAVFVFLLPLSWEMQFILFFLLSTILLVVGHLYLRPMMKSGEPSDLNDRARTMVGNKVVAFTDFVNGHGRVTVGDTQWKANSESDDDPVEGETLVITSVVGATLIVAPEVKA